MSEMEKKAYEYRLPMETTQENLECQWSKTMKYGNKVIMAGHYYNGMNKPCYFGAVYEFTTDKTTCEDLIKLTAASEVEFWDEGSAIAWTIQKA